MNMKVTKRPKGKESLAEFITRRIKEIEHGERVKAKYIIRKKGILEQELIKQGYWPEEDTHHDVVRATLIIKSMIVGAYAASILMVFYIYVFFVEFKTEEEINPAYHAHFMYGDLFHYLEAEYVFFYPLFICLLYKMIWIHIPRMRELNWYKMVPEKEKTPFTQKLSKYMNYYMFFASLTLYSYGKLLTIYLTTYDLVDLVFVHNNDYEPLFYDWEIYLLKISGLWVELEVTFHAKYHACLRFIVNEQIDVPQPVKDYYNPRIGIVVSPWLYMKTELNQYAEDVFFAGLTKENPGHIPTLFKTLRTEGPIAAKEQFYILFKEEIDGYNQGMKDIQQEICHAYGRRKPLVAGQFPMSRYALSQPYPAQWLKEMAEGKR